MLGGSRECWLRTPINDHDKYTNCYEKFGIPVLKPFENGRMQAKFGNFTIRAFDLTDKDGKFVHTNSDGSECPCYGFYITHPELGTMVYATDCEYIKYRFSNINHFLVEANYSSEYVQNMSANTEHIYKGHMSIETACEFIKANNSNGLKNVILCHLSTLNSHDGKFIESMSKITNCPITIAYKGIVVNL